MRSSKRIKVVADDVEEDVTITKNSCIATPFDSFILFDPNILQIINEYVNIENSHMHWFYAHGLTDDKEKSFFCACANGDLKAARYLQSTFSKTRSVFILDEIDNRVLIESIKAAAQYGHVDVLSYLFSFNASFYRESYLIALENKRCNVLKYLLLYYRIDQLLITKTMEYFASCGNLVMVKHVLHNCINYQGERRSQLTRAYINACENGHLDIVQYCVDEIGNHAVHRAIHVAAKHGHLDLVKYFVSRNANIQFSNNHAIVTACQNDQWDIVEYLLTLHRNKDNL